MEWIYNRNGGAAMIINGDALYNAKGAFKAVLRNDDIYNVQGQFKGWMEGGVLRTPSGIIGFLLNHTGHIPSNPTIGGKPGFPPLGARSAMAAAFDAPHHQGSTSWAPTLFEEYFAECNK